MLTWLGESRTNLFDSTPIIPFSFSRTVSVNLLRFGTFTKGSLYPIPTPRCTLLSEAIFARAERTEGVERGEEGGTPGPWKVTRDSSGVITMEAPAEASLATWGEGVCVGERGGVNYNETWKI